MGRNPRHLGHERDQPRNPQRRGGPPEFPVAADRPLRPIEVGRTRLRFVKKAHLVKTTTVGIQTPSGQIRVSSPEATALDLVRYPEHAGALGNVATVVRELAERLDAHAPVRAAEAEGEHAHAHRLGYLLDQIGRAELAAPLVKWLQKAPLRVTPLRPVCPITGAPRDARWRVAVNAEVEIDATSNPPARGYSPRTSGSSSSSTRC